MSKTVELHKVEPTHHSTNRPTNMDVVFIHGLGGDHDGTWRASPTAYWPQFAADAHPTVQVWALDYPAKKGKLLPFDDDQPGTQTLSVLITERLRTQQIGERPCIFVCHSLGGLIAKRILLDAWEIPKQDVTRFKYEGVNAVMFCGTPHRGAAMASVLRVLEHVKGMAFKHVLPYLGLVHEKIGELASDHLATTSKLIEELEKNNVGLQHLNEDFGRYYQARAGEHFMICQYAETEKLKLLGVPTATVVPEDSANPNLRIGSAPPLRIIPVPGKDHMQLVKPESSSDWVVEGLDDLIRRVKDKDWGFDPSQAAQRQVGMLIHAELFKTPNLLNLSCFRMLTDEASPKTALFQAAKALAAIEGDAVLDQLSSISKSYGEISKKEDAQTLHDGLTRIGCALLLNYVQADAHSSANQQGGPEIGVAEFDDPEQLDIMIEALHASLRHWPVQLRLNEERNALVGSSWKLSPAAVSPGSWRDDDHLNHLIDRVLSTKATYLKNIGGPDNGPWPKEGDAPIGAPKEQKIIQARALLHSRLLNQAGLLLDIRAPGNPYAGDSDLRERVRKAFGDFVTLVLPDACPSPDEATLTKLSTLQSHAQQFLLEAERTRP